jgi:hypothetical protein
MTLPAAGAAVGLSTGFGGGPELHAAIVASAMAATLRATAAGPDGRTALAVRVFIVQLRRVVERLGINSAGGMLPEQRRHLDSIAPFVFQSRDPWVQPLSGGTTRWRHEHERTPPSVE